MIFFFSRVFFFIQKKYTKIKSNLFCVWCAKQMKSCGKNFRIHTTSSVLSLNRISVGDNFSTGPLLRLRAYDVFENEVYNPLISIGNDFYAGQDCSVMAVGTITIGNNVTLASRVTIIDHSHGKGDYSDIDIPVMKRRLGCKGPIIIEDNVWLCEGGVVLSGVRIGKSSIIGANSVVTHDIPPYSIAVGIPAKVIGIVKTAKS